METALIISIISLSVTAVFGLWNIFIQIDAMKARQREEIRTLENRKKQELDMRPRLEIAEFSLNYNGEGNKKLIEDCDLEILVVPIKGYNNSRGHAFFYEDGAALKSNWASATYKLVNVGKSEITHLRIATNYYKQLAVLGAKNSLHVFYMENHLLSLSEIFDKVIKPGDGFTLKINYLKEKIAHSPIGAELSIWTHDSYGNYWEQPFFAHDGKLYESKKTTYAEYRENTIWEEILKRIEREAREHGQQYIYKNLDSEGREMKNSKK